MKMKLSDIKAFEDNHTVADILSTYIMCSKDKIMQSLIGDGVDVSYGLIDYWSEINRTDIQLLLDTIEINLYNCADFNVIGTFVVPITKIEIVKSVLKLSKDIIIPLEWSLP